MELVRITRLILSHFYQLLSLCLSDNSHSMGLLILSVTFQQCVSDDKFRRQLRCPCSPMKNLFFTDLCSCLHSFLDAYCRRINLGITFIGEMGSKYKHYVAAFVKCEISHFQLILTTILVGSRICICLVSITYIFSGHKVGNSFQHQSPYCSCSWLQGANPQ